MVALRCQPTARVQNLQGQVARRLHGVGARRVLDQLADLSSRLAARILRHDLQPSCQELEHGDLTRLRLAVLNQFVFMAK